MPLILIFTFAALEPAHNNYEGPLPEECRAQLKETVCEICM
jgi:hypothetical protein